ncbi:hypothetical protein [Amycolatopsis magusensis]|uniref:hypothetical protein n=1 Tax=Amycolatopsis magusensis TaxID=882444 RepID=UPI0037B5EBDF
MNTVLGRPVTGEIANTAEHRAEQKPGEELLPLLDAVLAWRQVDAVRWSQFTPYFNDGEPCVFGAQHVEVKLAGDDTAGYYEDGFVGIDEMADYRRGEDGYSRTVKPQFQGVYQALLALEDQLEHFEDFLHGSFGDHAQVTATRDGFHIADFDHD